MDYAILHATGFTTSKATYWIWAVDNASMTPVSLLAPILTFWLHPYIGCYVDEFTYYSTNKAIKEWLESIWPNK